MFRNGFGRRGGGRGAGFGGRGRGGAGYGPGRGWGRGAGNWQNDNWEPGIGWNQPLSNLAAGVPESERKSWLERFKAHLSQRMNEVDEALKDY